MDNARMKCGEGVVDVSLHVRCDRLVEDAKELFGARGFEEPEPDGAILEVQSQFPAERTLGERGKFPAPADGDRYGATIAFQGDDRVSLKTELVSTQ
jgi:hypothetical protein